MNKVLVLIVEGDTELEFYRILISNAQKKRIDKKSNDIKIEYINAGGIGGFKNIALRKFLKVVKPKYNNGEYEFVIALCRDTDVFEFSPKPPVNWTETEAAFKSNGAKKVIHIKAEHCIEDWFLIDTDGIKSFLGLPKETKIPSGNGCKAVQSLFKKANKVYHKGKQCADLIEKLDIEKIAQSIRFQLDPLYKELGIQF